MAQTQERFRDKLKKQIDDLVTNGFILVATALLFAASRTRLFARRAPPSNPQPGTINL